MPSEIEGVRALLVGKPRPIGWPERRQRMDEVCAIDPPAGDIAFSAVEIAGIPAEWSLAPGSDPEKVLLYLHGGGYCSGSIRSHRGMVGEIGRAAGIRTLALGFRLAPEDPFPAALEDAMTAYHFLHESGLAGSRIAIGGDSAGGGLSLATAISLRAAKVELPGCLWLLSPWVDLEMTGGTMVSKDTVDPLIHRDYLEGLASAYAAGAERRDPLVSPLHADLFDLPPTLVQVGACETLLDDAVRITAALGAANVATSLEIWPDMIHAWPVWWKRLEAGRRAIANAGRFLRQSLG
ncbi:MAG: alpha/beta hydrolase [Xanthobacteraceae bacterium]|jgi:acetyl esterase/lipase|nr:alpha/beta hydrolase [Xanthobacteraceae bacterium]